MTKAKPEQDTQGRFLSGNSGGGRPKGSRNRLGEEFLRVLAADFEKHGQAVIETVRANKPEVYARICADLLPKDINLNRDPLEDLSSDQLLARLEVVRRANGHVVIAADDHSKREEEPGSVH